MIFIPLILISIIFLIFWYVMLFELFFVDLFISSELQKLYILIIPYIFSDRICENYIASLLEKYNNIFNSIISEYYENRLTINLTTKFREINNIRKLYVMSDFNLWTINHYIKFYLNEPSKRKTAIKLYKTLKNRKETE